MSLISLILQNVYENVYVLPMKSLYSEPKIYTGGIQVKQWSKLSKKDQKKALSKEWYVYYSFRHPESLKLIRQPAIKGGANRFKTKRERYKFLQVIQRNLSLMLQNGFNPYQDNSEVESSFFGIDKPSNTKNEINKKDTISESIVVKYTIKDAFELVLKLKKKTLAESSFPQFKGKINQFQKWLLKNEYKLTDDVSKISKKTVINYLNEVLLKTSSRTRNNARSDINSLFQLLKENGIVNNNFVKEINVLKSKPKRHKTYNSELETMLFKHLEAHEPILFLFIKFICYNFLRPIEICRLKVGDIYLKEKKLVIKTKGENNKTKIIPDILFNELPDLTKVDKNLLLFTPNKIGGYWNAKEKSRRENFTDRFKLVKDKFGLGVDYGLYSFRHTFITKLYRSFRKSLTPFEAKSKLMLITGHSTMEALNKYLRDIDAELPEDYSDDLINK